MRPDRSGFPKVNRRPTAAEGRADEFLITAAGDLFVAGFDTAEIARRLVMPECAVLAALHVARERQRELA
jgi:hypothetical protein